jgi:hypothetical protein
LQAGCRNFDQLGIFVHPTFIGPASSAENGTSGGKPAFLLRWIIVQTRFRPLLPIGPAHTVP